MRSTARPNSSWNLKVPRTSISLATTVFWGIETSPPSPSCTSTPRGLSTSRPDADGPLVSGRLELHVEIALVGSVVAELLGIARNIDGAIGADLFGLFQDRIHHIGRHDLSRAVRARGDDGKRTDRTAAGDENALAEQRARPRDRMQGHGERLGKSGLVDRDAVVDLVALPFLGDKALAKCALNMRHRHRAAVEAHVQAVVLLAAQAVLADVAGPARRNRHAVTDGKFRTIGAQSP